MILWIPLEFDNWLLRYLKTHEDFDIGFSQEFVSVGNRGFFLEVFFFFFALPSSKKTPWIFLPFPGQV